MELEAPAKPSEEGEASTMLVTKQHKKNCGKYDQFKEKMWH